MNPDNFCNLTGCVQDEPWTRWRAPRQGVPRGQIRFWLQVSRELAGDGCDRLLCAIEPKDEAEFRRYEQELRSGRTVHLVAQACSTDTPTEGQPGVIFVAESCGFDGQETQHVHHKHRQTGKMAAAGDDSGAELPLGGLAQ